MLRIDISGGVLSSCVSLRLGTYESILVRSISLGLQSLVTRYEDDHEVEEVASLKINT
jgi:hypothetical protein